MTIRRARFALLFLALAVMTAVAAGLLACGPSFQAVYEGNAKFEHCYALEERPQSPLSEKADCWHDWSERYTYGQTRDRIQYATARYVALSQSVPTDEAMMMAAPGMTPRTSTITAPDPTNAFAPPPKVLDQADAGPGKAPRLSEVPVIVGFGPVSVDAGDGGPGTRASEAGVLMKDVQSMKDKPLPQTECVESCAQRFHACSAAASACGKDYRGCVRDCVK